MTKQLLLSALAVAALSLSACSSEPSDWRPDKKVSVDMVEPGSRSSDNFDQHTEAAASQHKGGAIAEPISSHVTLDQREKPSAEHTTSANAHETLKNKSDETEAEKATTANPAAKEE